MSRFPLEPLYAVREIRLRALEQALQAAREVRDQAARQHRQAELRLQEAGEQRARFAADGWRALFAQGAPSGAATAGYERHLQLLDHRIAQARAELDASAQALAEAQAAFDTAAAAWRRSRGKLDAIGTLKQDWLRASRGRSEAREEQGLEELLLRPAKPS